MSECLMDFPHHPSWCPACYEENQRAQLIVEQRKANELKEYMRDAKGGPPDKITLKDYTSYDFRAVWAEWGEGGEATVILVEKWPWPFLPGWRALSKWTLPPPSRHENSKSLQRTNT